MNLRKEKVMDIIEQIKKLKKREKCCDSCAHYYVPDEVQAIAGLHWRFLLFK